MTSILTRENLDLIALQLDRAGRVEQVTGLELLQHFESSRRLLERLRKDGHPYLSGVEQPTQKHRRSERMVQRKHGTNY